MGPWIRKPNAKKRLLRPKLHELPMPHNLSMTYVMQSPSMAVTPPVIAFVVSGAF